MSCAGLPMWNQFSVPCPGTSAHKLDLANAPHLRSILPNFLKHLQEQQKQLDEYVCLMQSEVNLLKRFLYKLTSVFSHDKSYKTSKQIQKSINKFLAVNISLALKSLEEQHSFSSSTDRFVFVAPKPRIEFVLVRLQGCVRLLAQVLCYSQKYGSQVIQKIRLGHFMNISVISMAFAARLWVLSLHIMHILIDLYKDLKQVYSTKDFPDSTVQFVPKDYKFPRCLLQWLKEDDTLLEIHQLLKQRAKEQTAKTPPAAAIWDSIQVDDDEEREHLLQLKQLVCSKIVPKTEAETENALREEKNVPLKFQADLGELVSRDTTTPAFNSSKQKRKRGKKRKLKEA